MALPLVAQAEEKFTVCGVVTGWPPLVTVTLTLVVPNAVSGLTPKTGVPTTTAWAPTEKPRNALVAGFWLDAVRVAAPEALPPFTVIVAVPVASVSAVPEAGTSVASVGSVLNVTTILGTGRPAASLTIALAIAGTTVVVAPVVALASVITIVGTPATGGGGTTGAGPPVPEPPGPVVPEGPNPEPDEPVVVVSLHAASASTPATRRAAADHRPTIFISMTPPANPCRDATANAPPIWRTLKGTPQHSATQPDGRHPRPTNGLRTNARCLFNSWYPRA